jgi:NCS2 family nucleobase:cation symporter-2
MNDAAWRHPDMRNIAAAIRADGLGCLVGGLLGVPGLSAAPTLVSVERTTGATSRVIAWSVALWFILLSCLPKFAGLIVNMPRPVMAAALFFNGALMLVAGIQIVASRPITLRASIIIGLTVLAALTVPIFPDFLSVVASVDPAVHWFDHHHGGNRRRASQRRPPARDVALQLFASRDGFRTCHARVLRCFL